MHGWPYFFFLFFFFFFSSDERGHQTTEKIQLLREKKKNGCSNFAPKYIERSLPIYLIFDRRDDHLYFRDNSILYFLREYILTVDKSSIISPSPVRKKD